MDQQGFIKAEQDLDKAEKKYLRENGIMNPDGTVPKSLWMMDDEELFDLHVEAFGKIAEEALIEFGLSISPEGIRETLRKGVAHSVKIREKFIDTTYRLDVETM